MERAPAFVPDSPQLRIADYSTERTSTLRDSIWAGLQEMRVSPETLARNRITTDDRCTAAHAAIDMIRTKVLQMLRQNGWKSVVITSPTFGCGKSLVALKLALSFSNQMDCRTVLLDLDLKHPRIGDLLDIEESTSMQAFLSGDCDMTTILRRYERNLAIGANRWSVKYSAELLQSREAARVLKQMQQLLDPDVVIYDMTSMLPSDDVTAFLPNVDCAILVVEAGRSTFEEVDSCERYLSDRTNVLGVVLNKCRHPDN
jgi:Mrp family chromosome partitioning ATPase